MATYLWVIAPFGDYQVGDDISDPGEVAELADRRECVVPVLAPELKAEPEHVDVPGHAERED